MGLYIICDLPHIIGDGHRNGWPHNYGKEKTMENQNANDVMNLADLVQPQDAEIEALQAELVRVKEELIVAKTWGADRSRADDLKAEQLDQLGDAIMALIGDKATALIESHANDLIENAMNDFNIHDHEYEIGDMIDERLPEGLDDESRSDDLKAAIKEVLSGATLTMDIE